MGKIAFLFAGQGAQYVGMSQSFYEQIPACRETVEACDRLTGGKMTDIAFHGTEEQLKKTANTQPCLFTADYLCYQTLLENGARPDGVAGFSLGEYAALCAAGAFDFTTGLRLVIKRGEYMEQAAAARPGGMAAVLGLKDEQVEAVCQAVGDSLQPVNYNCDGQLVVAGTKEDLALLEAKVKELGGKFRPLNVSGAFHSSFMAPAADRLSEELANISIKKTRIPTYSNVTGEPFHDKIEQVMVRQVKCPVKWKQSIARMLADGFISFITLGPGKTLLSLMRRIDKQAAVCQCDSMETLEQALAFFKEAKS